MSLFRTRLLWDRLFASYYNRGTKDRTEALYLSLRETLRAHVFSELSRGGRLLDAGCGPGHLMALLADDVPRATLFGVDFSSTMVRVAASALAKSPARHAWLVQGDIHHLPFADGSLDVVLSICSLKWWTDPVACLNEIHRVARPHATIMLVEMNREATAGEIGSWKRELARSLPTGNPGRKWIFEHVALANSFSTSDVERIVRQTHFSTIDLGTVRGYPFLRAIARKPGRTSRG